MSAIKERPILFSAPMVRAILAGRKTVTRRPVKGGQIPKEDESEPIGDRMRWSAIGQVDRRYGFCVFGATEEECAKELEQFAPCPYGRPGERLWVRETWAEVGIAQADPDKKWFVYRECDNLTDYGGPWKPSIFMPRRACRILLEITAVRVERLRDIDGDQAHAEGIYSDPHKNGMYTADGERHTSQSDGPVESFAALWESINGAGAWAANPWVWVVEFKRVTP